MRDGLAKKGEHHPLSIYMHIQRIVLITCDAAPQDALSGLSDPFVAFLVQQVRATFIKYLTFTCN
jgi:hypothetical protein